MSNLQKIVKQEDDYGVETFEPVIKPKTVEKKNSDEVKPAYKQNDDAPIQLDEEKIYE